ncbi:hypothetical protein [Halobacillus massiliensis]|nr:hypothetical protein [Halobacillus massiliensis]
MRKLFAAVLLTVFIMWGFQVYPEGQTIDTPGVTEIALADPGDPGMG